MIVADTGALVALVDRDDRHHSVLRELYESDPDRSVEAGVLVVSQGTSDPAASACGGVQVSPASIEDAPRCVTVPSPDSELRSVTVSTAELPEFCAIELREGIVAITSPTA